MKHVQSKNAVNGVCYLQMPVVTSVDKVYHSHQPKAKRINRSAELKRLRIQKE